MQSKQKGDLFPRVCWCSTIALLYVLGAGYTELFTVLALLLTVIYTVFVCKTFQDLLEIQLTLLPFAGVMFFGGSVSVFNIISVLVLAKVCILQRMKLLKEQVHLLIIIMGLSCLFLKNQGVEGVRSILLFGTGLMIMGFFITTRQNISVYLCARIFAIALIASAIVYELKDYLPSIKTYIIESSYRYNDVGDRVTRISGLMGNPNYFTLAINLIIAILMSSFLRDKAEVIDIVITLIMVALGILSLSKSFVLALVFNVGLVLIYLCIKAPSKWLRAMLFIAIVGIGVLSFAGEQYIDILLERLSIGTQGRTLDVNSYASGRFDKFELYFDYWAANPLDFFLGSGYAATIDGHASHNVYIETFFYFGVIGGCALLVWILKSQRKHKRRNSDFLSVVPLLVLLFRGLAINIWISITFPYYLIITLIYLGYTGKVRKEDTP